MEWNELLHDEKYLRGEILCIHHLVVHPQLVIKGTVEDFNWAKRPEMALVSKGPVDRFFYHSTKQIFSVSWQWLNEINPDFSIGAELRSEAETGIPDRATISTEHHKPTFSEHGILWLGTDHEVTDIYLLPVGYEFHAPTNF